MTEVSERTRVAVERLLEQAPFSALSVEDIITEAGIARSTFYVYFADKRQMLDALTADLLDEALVVVSAWWQLPPDADYAGLRSALSRFVEFFHQHRALLKAVIDAAGSDSAAEAGFGRMVAAGEAGIAAHIRAGQAAGSVTAGIDPEAVASWLVRLVEQGVYELITPAGQDRRERLIDALSMLVWNTLYRGARSAARAGVPA